MESNGCYDHYRLYMATLLQLCPATVDHLVTLFSDHLKLVALKLHPEISDKNRRNRREKLIKCIIKFILLTLFKVTVPISI